MTRTAVFVTSWILVTLLAFTSCKSPGQPVPGLVILNQIDLSLSDGTGTLNGNIIVQIRDAVGNTPAITEVTFPASDLTSDPDSWHSVAISGCTLTSGTKYRIYVQRSIALPTDPLENIDWRGNSATGIDYYPEGVNDWALTAPSRSHCDYSFRTYDNSVVDQSMESSDYTFTAMSNASWKWQEFVAGAS